MGTLVKDNTKQEKTKVFIVDDHSVLRHGLRRLIEEKKNYEVCGEAEDGSQALVSISKCNPDVAIVDLSLKSMGGLELIKNLQRRCPTLPILVMSMHDESIYAERVLAAGAKGYVMKKESSEEVLEAIQQILNGKIYISKAMQEKFLNKMTSAAPTINQSPVDVLSDRELEVFELLGQGLKTSEVAEKLHLGVKTIETYRNQIKEKFNLENSAKLIQSAVQWVTQERLN